MKLRCEEVAEMAIASIKEAGVVADEVSRRTCMVSEIVALYHDQMSYMNEIVELALFFRRLKWENEQAKEVLQARNTPTVLNAFVRRKL